MGLREQSSNVRIHARSVRQCAGVSIQSLLSGHMVTESDPYEI